MTGMDRDKRATLRIIFVAIGVGLGVVVAFVFGFVGPDTDTDWHLPPGAKYLHQRIIVETQHPLDFQDLLGVILAAGVGGSIGFVVGEEVAKEIYK